MGSGQLYIISNNEMVILECIGTYVHGYGTLGK